MALCASVIITASARLAICEQAGIRDPWEYVRDILQKLSRRWPQSRLDELLPLTWYRARSDD
jgi:hypothetical protein